MTINVTFDNTYMRDLEGFYVAVKGAKVPEPAVLRFNEPLARELGLDPADFSGRDGGEILTGATRPDGAAGIAMAYAGHQFGGFSPQLGDGRALLVGEILNDQGRRFDIHLKGSGRTPFSRGGDGKAVLGPVLREFLIGEAMHHLGIPTTRALAASTTGEMIMRQNGPEPGAVLARVAASHLRVGTFQFFAAKGQTSEVRRLADYAIRRHYPDLADMDQPYLALFQKVAEMQARLVAKWVAVGFVHGVMNTDNMTISGETIDYGPCAFIDAYDPKAVYSSIDQHGRYAFGNQPVIAQWNLARLAETLIGLIDPVDTDAAIARLTAELEAFPGQYQRAWLAEMRLKLGLVEDQPGDLSLVNALFEVIEGQGVDYTKLFRSLSLVLRGDREAARSLFAGANPAFDTWSEGYLARLEMENRSLEHCAEAMNRVNPIYIARNHLVEEALEAANGGEMGPFDRLLDILRDPFVEQPGAERYAEPAPEGFGPYTTYCGT